jgi:ParB family chromosome partitioning protein
MAKAKKEQLGKGLASLLGNIEREVNENPQKVVKELTMNFAMVPIDSIERYTGQPRTEFDETLITELSESIRVHGVIQPLTVRMLSQTDQKYQLISGERRWRAARKAGLTEVPAYIRIANDQQMLEMALVENIQRADLNPIEVAITYQRLIDECNLTHEILAERVAKSRPAISNSLRLLRLPPAIQQAIKAGKVSTGHAKVLAGVEDLGLQNVLLQRILSEEISVRQLEDIVRDWREDKAKAKKKEADAPSFDALRPVTDSLSSFFGSKVRLARNNDGSGKMTVAFKSDDDLNRILDMIEDLKKHI